MIVLRDGQPVQVRKALAAARPIPGPQGRKKKKRQPRYDDNPARLKRTLMPLIYMPRSKEDSLRLEAVDQLDHLHLTASWFKLVPSHLGTSETVDLSARLFVLANEVSIRAPSLDPSHRPSPSLLESYWRLYGSTLSSLRRLITSCDGALSDDALLSCALLAHCERGMGFQSPVKDVPLKNTLSHLHGIQAILTARPPTREPSELSFAILSGQQTLLYEVPIAIGTASPFEKMAWFQPPPAGSSDPTVQVKRLRLIGQRLLIDLPRLEMYVTRVNKITQSGTAKTAPLWATRNLAKTLLACKDLEAENTLLHRVKVCATSKKDNAAYIPYSFTFSALPDFEAGMYYWQSRLMLMRLCWRIARFDSTFDREQVVVEGVRTTRNLLMSWQYGEEQMMFGLIRYVFAAKVIWGAVTDFQEAFGDIHGLRELLVRRIAGLMGGIFGRVDENKLDDIAKGLDSDGNDGPMARLYRKNWPGRIHNPSTTDETTAPFDPDMEGLDAARRLLYARKAS